ncbi:MAG: hypothetical protein ABII90_09700 [Bacteroidota bacterium]
MKKVILLLFATGMFTFVACNQGAQEAEDTTTEEVVAPAEEPAEPVAEEQEALVEHACNDECTEDAHNYLPGEIGFEATEEEGTEEEEQPEG